MSRILTYQKTLLSCAVVLFAAALMWAFRGNNVPIVSDEIGYISIAKYLVTGQQITLSIMPVYRFGQALLLAPIYWFGPSDQTAYNVAVLVNCLQTALVPVVLIGIAKRFGMGLTWQVVVASFLVAVFPTYMYQNAVVWPEVTFRLGFLVAVYFVASAWMTRRAVYWALAAVSVAWVYSLHARGIGIVPAYYLVLFSGYRREKIGLLPAIASAALLLGLAAMASRFQAHIATELWGSSGGEFRQILELLLTPKGMNGFAAAFLGHSWSQIAGSMGLALIGLAAAWKLFQRQLSVFPALFFALMATGVGMVAAAAQLAMLARVDHLIYSRYNDGFFTLFVWLGLWWVLSAAAPLQRSGVAVAVATVLLGAAALVIAPEGITGMVTPNIPAFLWTRFLAPLQTASAAQIVAVASLATVAIASLVCLRPGRAAACLIAVIVVLVGFDIKRNVWRAHYGRELVTQRTALEYQKVGHPVYWDRSAVADLNIMFDQFSAIGEAMPLSDISVTDINQGEAAVVAPDFKKAGYTCVARLPYKTKLLKRAPGPDAC